MDIQAALVKFEYKEPTIEQIAIHVGFNENEIKLMTLFWSDDFDKNWIYLSDDMILNSMTNETGRMYLTHFYNQVLFTDFIVDIDYKEIKKDDNLIKKYEEVLNIDQSSIINKIKSNRKKYYAITGKTYVDLIKNSKYRLSKKRSLIQEKDISDKLSLLLNGKREVFISDNSRRIDILTDTEIIEVKKYTNRLASVGQILYYSKYYSNHKMRIHLFNHDNQKDIIFEEICNHLNITITYE